MSSIRANANVPGPNLFLRHLPLNMMEPELERLLVTYGRLKRLTVWKDHVTRQSKGFGMAEFETTEASMQAVKALQNQEIVEGHPLEIEYHHGKRKADGSPDIGAPCTNLYVRGLPLTMTEDQFHDILVQYGDIKRHTIWKDQFGASKGFGMAEFGSADQARAGLEALRGKSFDSTNVLHVEVNPPKKRIPPPHHTQMPVGGFMQGNMQHVPVANLFIKGLPPAFDESELQALVSRYGHVKRATIWRDRGTGQSKGFGLVELADSQQAAQAMDALNNLIPSEGSPPLQVEYNHPKPSKMNQGDPIAPGACSNIFLKCLPLTYTDADLHNLLSSFGRIVRSTIWKDNKTNQSRGFGFCEFSSPLSAASAIQALNGRLIHGSMTPIHVELHTRTSPGTGSPIRGMPPQQVPHQQVPQQVVVPQQQGGFPQQPPSQMMPMGSNQSQTVGSQQNPSVVIKGLPKLFQDADLKAMLDQQGVGRVSWCFVWKDRHTNEPQGWGMAQFETFSAARNAITNLNNVRLPNSHTQLSLEFQTSQTIASLPEEAAGATRDQSTFSHGEKSYNMSGGQQQGLNIHRPSFP